MFKVYIPLLLGLSCCSSSFAKNVFVQNQCPYTVRLAAKWLDSYTNTWTTGMTYKVGGDGFWTIPPYADQSLYIIAQKGDDVPSNVKTEQQSMYIYTESLLDKSTKVWLSGNTKVQYGKKVLGMQKVDFLNGYDGFKNQSYGVVLRCSSSCPQGSIGVEFTEKQPYTITRVLRGSDAEEQGLRVGDVITKINEILTSSLKTSEEVSEVLRGGSGTTVWLDTYRPSTNEQKVDQTLTRSCLK